MCDFKKKKALGIIEKQTIKGTFYAYLGVLLGFINTGLLLPNIISAAENGLIGLLNSYASIFALIGGLGFNSTIIRLFTYFRNEKNGHNGFVYLMNMITLAGIILSVALYIALYSLIYQENIEQSPLYLEYFYHAIPLLVAYLLFSVFDNYFTVLYNATIGLFLNEFLKRVFFSMAIAFYYFDIISFEQFVNAYIAAFFVPPIIMLFILIRDKQFKIKFPPRGFLTKALSRSMLSVSLFSLISSFAGIVVMRVDIIMLSSMIGLSGTGIYTITYFFGTLIKIPSRALTKISSALYADAWKNDDLQFIADIYKKSVINQSILGMLIFLGIIANMENIFHLLPDEYRQGEWVIIYISLAGLAEMFAGANNVIISTSPHYKMITYFTIVLMILTVLTNYWLIPLYGLTGASLASLISTLVYILLRSLFLRYKYQFKVYDIKLLLIILAGVFTYFIATFLPAFDSFILDIIVRSSIISLIFALIILAMRVSPELNVKIMSYKKMVINWIKK